MLILLMASSIVAAGIPVAIRAYDSVINTSNAQLLLDSTLTALRDELGTAREIDCNETTGAVNLYLSNNGFYCYVSSESTGIMLNYTEADKTTAYTSLPLVSNSALTHKLHSEYEKLVYVPSTQMFYVKNLKIVKDGSGKVLAERADVYIRALNPPPAA